MLHGRLKIDHDEANMHDDLPNIMMQIRLLMSRRVHQGVLDQSPHPLIIGSIRPPRPPLPIIVKTYLLGILSANFPLICEVTHAYESIA